MSVFQFFLESLDQGVAQFLGRHLCPYLRLVISWVIVAPFVVVFFVDFSGAVLLRNRSPSAYHLRQMRGVLPSSGVYAKNDLTIPVLYGKPIEIFKGEERMYQTEIAVNIRDIQRQRGYLQGIITGSKRGLDTRVSLKQALAAQGFTGGTRGATEWNLWVQSEKEQLAQVMERYGFEWEHLGTHEQNLSVIEFKKQERSKELAVVEEKLADKSAEFNTLSQRMNNLEKGSYDYDDLGWNLANDPKYQLPEPQGFTTVKSYKTKIVEPLIKRLKSLISNLLVRYFKVQDNYIRVKEENGKLYRENQNLIDSTDRLREENYALREQNKDYTLLRKVFGSQQIDNLIERAKEAQQAQKRQRQKNRGWER